MSKTTSEYGFWAQFGIAADQLLNVFPCFGYADETLSARAFRAWSKGRLLGRVFMPLIDLLFCWQSPDDEVNQHAGKVITRHCERAYYKEILRRSLPPEYRTLVAARTAGASVQPAPQDMRDFVFGSLAADGIATPFQWNLSKLPKNFDLREHEDFVEDQAGYQSCVGNAATTMLELFQAKRGVQRNHSRLFVYYNAREALAKMLNQPVQDTGTSTFTAMGSLTRYGVCQEAAWGYYNDVNAKPSDPAYAEAAQHLVGRYERIGRDSYNMMTGEAIRRDMIADVMVAVYCGMPVVFAIPISYEFFSTSGPLETHPAQHVAGAVNRPPGNHAMCIIGWRTLADGRVIFIVENSWGPGWGDGGFWGVLASDLAGAAFDLFTARSFDGLRGDIPMELYRWADGSVEGQAARLYRAAMGRYPDKDGLIYQANAIQTLGLVQVAAQFLASPEFQARYPDADDAAFVTLLYRNVLGREPDAAGLQYHVADLAAGVPRNAKLLHFSESPECRAL